MLSKILAVALSTLLLGFSSASPAPPSTWERLPTAPDQVSSLIFVGNTLYAAAQAVPDNGQRGIYKSTDFGATWVTVNVGLPSNRVTGNLVTTADGTLTLSTLGGPDYRLVGNVWQVIPNSTVPFYSDRVVAGNGDLLQVNQITTDNIKRSTDNGRTYSVLSTISTSGYGASVPYGLYKGPNGTVYVATEHDGIHASTDNGATWNWLGVYEVYEGQVWPFGNPHAMKVNAAGQLVVGTGQSGIFVYTGNGSKVTCRIDPTPATIYSPCECLPVNGGPGCGAWTYARGYANGDYMGKGNTVHDLLLLPNGEMLAHGGRMYRSTDGGFNWVMDDQGIPAGRLNTNYPDGILSLLHHTMALGPDGRVYVGIPVAGFGIYRTAGATPVPSPTPTPAPSPRPTPVPSPSPSPSPQPSPSPSPSVQTIQCTIVNKVLTCPVP